MNTPRVALLILALLLSPQALAAEPSPEAMARAADLYDNAAILYEEGSYEAAIAGFRASLELSGAQELHYNIASCLERLGRLEDAIAELNLYRAFAAPEERDRLERRMRMLEEKLAEERAAPPTVTTTAAPPPQEITTTPLPAPRRHPRWGMVGVGAGLGLVGGVGATMSWLDAQQELTDEDQDQYEFAQQLNLISWSVVGVGALTTTLGLVIPVKTAAGGELLLAPGHLSFTW